LVGNSRIVRGWIVEDRLHHRQQVGQRLAAGSAGGDHDVVAGARGLERLELVAIQAIDAALGERGDERRVQPCRQRHQLCGSCRQRACRDDPAGERGEVY
jgi:hypothetical protein